MSWLRVQFFVENHWSQTVCDALQAAGALAVTTQCADDQACYQGQLATLPLWEHLAITGLFPARQKPEPVVGAIGRVLGHHGLPRHRIDYLDDRDWECAWLDSFQPRQVGRRLWVCPTQCEPPRPEAVNILLDPGLAFGTGTHATTGLCLDWLSRNPPVGLDVVDYGCGSGILAIAALKLGASYARGVDIDPQALSVSEDNARHNRVKSRFRALLPNDLPKAQTADVVIANILANTLIALAPRLSSMMRSGGHLLLSGILKDQGALVKSHYSPSFLFEQHCRDDWLLLAGIRQ